MKQALHRGCRLERMRHALTVTPMTIHIDVEQKSPMWKLVDKLNPQFSPVESIGLAQIAQFATRNGFLG
jgi:hypothetical protein